MPSNLNVTLAGAILQVINTVDSSTRVNSSLGSPTLPATESTYIDFLPIATGAGTVIPLPATTIFFFFMKNLGGVNGQPSGNIQVLIQPVGGVLASAANSPMVLPGGLFIYANTAESAGGLLAVTLVSSVANVPVELLMAA